jgi:hypothetical protein
MEELDRRILEIVRLIVNGFMEIPVSTEIHVFLEKREVRRNGYYERHTGAKYRKITNLKVQRNRNNYF